MAVLAPGVSQIVLGTPWPVGPVNAYLIDDDPLTLVDCGPRLASALDDLEAGLADAGRRVEDLERIVVTHQHLDHSGLARTLVDRSGAELCALEPMLEWMARYPASLAAEDAFATGVLRAHGVAAREAGRGQHRGGQDFGAPATVTRVLRDGDIVALAGRDLRVLHRPGHSPYDTVFHDEASGLLLGGDHLLHRPSSPILTPPAGDDARNGRPRAFAHYLASLRATEALEVDAVLPGHGDPIEDHRATIAERFARYDRITAQTLAAVSDSPRTAANIAVQLKGSLPPRTAFFVLCEVLGHLDELIDAGAVVEDPGGFRTA